MKKAAKGLVVLAVLLAAVAVCAACREKTPSPTPATPTVTLDRTSVTMDLYETVTLTAVTENTDEAVIWSSSDPTVATVENGVVSSVAEGVATVTATAGGGTASCEVTVAPSGEVPVLRMDKNSVTVKKGETVTVTATVSYKNETCDAAVAWTTEDPAIATAEGGRIVGVEIGDTTAVAVASWRGWSAQARIPVKVNDNVSFSLNASAVTLLPWDLSGTGEYQTQFALVPAVYDSGEAVASPAISYEIDHDTVATVGADGLITAVAKGVATVTATYTAKSGNVFSVTVDVTVTLPTADLREEGVSGEWILSESGDYTLEIADITGTVTTAAVLKGSDELPLEDVSGGDGGAVTIPGDAVRALDLYGYYDLLLETTRYSYTLTVAFVTDEITTVDEFNKMGEKKDGAGNVIGMYTLGQDIDFEGAAVAGVGAGVLDTSKLSNSADDRRALITDIDFTDKWAGIFDGKGHALKNFKITERFGGLFSYIAEKGVVKNLAILDGVVEATGSGNTLGGGRALVATYTEGTICDLFVTGTINAVGNMINLPVALVTCGIGETCHIHDVFAVMKADWSHTGTMKQYGATIVGSPTQGYGTSYQEGEYDIYNLLSMDLKYTGADVEDFVAAHEALTGPNSAVGSWSAARYANLHVNGLDGNHMEWYGDEAEIFATDSHILGKINPISPLKDAFVRSFVSGWTDATAWAESNGEDFKGFDSPVWTKLGGGLLPVFAGFESALIPAAAEMAPAIERSVQIGEYPLAPATAWLKTTYALQDPVEGIRIDDNTLIVEESGKGQSATIVATSVLFPSLTYEFEIVADATELVDLRDEGVLGELILSADGDYTLEIADITEAVTNAVIVNGLEEISLDGVSGGSDGTVLLSGDPVRDLDLYGYYDLKLETARYTYRLTVAFVTDEITTVDEFNKMGDKKDEEGNVVGMYTLGRDLDFEGAEVAGVGSGTISEAKASDGRTATITDVTFTDKWAGIFDGKGHALKNIKIKERFGGLFSYITEKGVVKNLAILDGIVDASGTGNADGGARALVATYTEGTICDLFVTGTIKESGHIHCLPSALVTCGIGTTCHIHDVFAVIKEDWDRASAKGSNRQFGGTIIGSASQTYSTAFQDGEYDIYNLLSMDLKYTGKGVEDFAAAKVNLDGPHSAVGTWSSGRYTNLHVNGIDGDHMEWYGDETKLFATDSHLLGKIEEDSPMKDAFVRSFVSGWTDATAWAKEGGADFKGFDSEVWTKLGGGLLPVFEGFESALLPSADELALTIGTSVQVGENMLASTTDWLEATYTIADPVDGIRIEGNKLIVEERGKGKSVTIKATSVLFPSLTRDITVAATLVDLTGKGVSGELILSESGDYTLEIDSITDAVTKATVLKDHEELPIAGVSGGAEGTVTLPGDAVRALDLYGYYDIELETAGYTCRLTVAFVTDEITTVDEFNKMSEKKDGAGNVIGLYTLGQDIDFEGAAVAGVGSGTISDARASDGRNALITDVIFTDKWAGIFDGKGHALKNFKITERFGGLFSYIAEAGVVKNLAILDGTVDATGTGNADGGGRALVATYTEGTISDLFVTGTITESGHIHSLPGALVTCGIGETCHIHDIFAVIKADWDRSTGSNRQWGGTIIGSATQGYGTSYIEGKYDVYNLLSLDLKYTGKGVEDFVAAKANLDGPHSAVGSWSSGRYTNLHINVEGLDDYADETELYSTDSRLLGKINPNSPLKDSFVRSFVSGWTDATAWAKEGGTDFKGFDSPVWTKVGGGLLPVFAGFESALLPSADELALTIGTTAQVGDNTLASTTDWLEATYSIAEPVEGVRIEGNQLIVEENAKGRSVTIKATSVLFPSLTHDITVTVA